MSRFLIEPILEPAWDPSSPAPPPPVMPEDIEVLCWMRIEAEDGD